MILAPIHYKITTVHIPLQTPFVTALRRVETATALRLILYDESGHIGIGEAPPTEAITGESIESMRTVLQERLLPALMGQRLTLTEALAAIHGTCKGHTSAKACLDIALHNLAAQKAKLPLWRFLGANVESQIETAVTVSLDAPDAMATQSAEFVAKGLKILKIKLGEGVKPDIQRVRAVRKAAPEATLLLDANQGWREGDALEVIEAVTELGVELIEQPLPAGDLEGMRRLTRLGPIPILADESAFSLEEVQTVIKTEAAHMINVKLMKCGGIAKAKEILAWCEARGVTCMMGSMLETPASIEAARALCALFPQTIRYADLDSPLLYASPTLSFLGAKNQ